MMVWEKLLPMLNFSFLCRHSKPPSSSMQPPPSYPCSLSQVFFPFFFFSFFPFHLNLSAATSPSPPPCLTLTQVISRRCHHQPHRRHLNTATTAPTPWPLQPPPRHPLQACQLPVAPALTRIAGTHKPPCCRRPHCS